ncbi:MAG: N-6 DNA methylase, partial [Planctomycetota bacterium]
MATHPLEAYLKHMLRIRAVGEATDETSYYPAMEALLNEAGKALKPKVRCILELKNRGAGHPDGGLFSQDQWQALDEDDPLGGQMPSRGVLEVKGLAEGTAATIAREQVAHYWAKYRKVIVTNYREFVLVGEDQHGQQAPLETYTLAKSAEAFWDLAAHPRKAARERGDDLLDYLQRVILIGARITDPQVLASVLASYARQALRRIAGRDLPALATIRTALEEALGMTFSGDKGEHFFESTFVQTLFYGVFSAWVLWSRQHPPTDSQARFDWRHSAEYLRVPILRKLFHEAAEPGQLADLGLAEILHWAAACLHRVDRAVFFDAFREDHAVQYFYEPFLEAYDPVLRKELGVWYTPEEIVQYQVARVDTVLREELDIADGLADPNVYVLDPCCGTGAYLVEVLRTIHATLAAKGDDALLAQDLKRAAMDRVFGFEILPAPFVISHLQLGLLLQDLGAPLANRRERVAVYLTNALTGWEPPKGPKKRFLFPELEEEREAAERVKRDVPILVILGNPPYNAFAGTSPEEERGLVEPYKEGLNKPVKDGGWGIKKFNLDDLYVRFLRLAERRIVDGPPGHGIVSFITNFSYFGDPSFVVMRERFQREFDQLWLDCMNGDSRETGKLTPDGEPDPSVFSTERNKAGIRVGTGICVLLRKQDRGPSPSVLFRHFWGTQKRELLLNSLSAADFSADYEVVEPRREAKYSFRPLGVAGEYLQWPRVTELCAARPSNGLLEKRGGALIDIDRAALVKRIERYYDPDTPWDELQGIIPGLTRPAARFRPKETRRKVLEREEFQPDNLRRYMLRPFDCRWCYYTPVRPVWNETRPTYFAQCWRGNRFLVTRPAGVAVPEGAPMYFTGVLGDNDFQRGHSYYFPVQAVREPEAKKRHRATASFLKTV